MREAIASAEVGDEQKREDPTVNRLERLAVWRNPEAYELLGSNPLPDTFRITPNDPDNIVDIRDAIACRARFLRGNRSVPGSPACLDDLGRARRGSGSAR